MTSAEAKEILLLYRPGVDESGDPQMAEALELAKRDPELGQWFKDHCAFQTAMRQKFAQVKVPADLKARLLAQAQAQAPRQVEPEEKIIRPAIWWRQPAWLAAAAAVALLIGLSVLLFKPASVPDRFANYQTRMVSDALRKYEMDIKTNNLQAIQQVIEARGAPGGYSIPKGLQQLSLAGGGALRWRDNPVAMVCYQQRNKQMLFLFVTSRSAVKDPPPEAPTTAVVQGLFTASWSAGDKIYLLAGPQEEGFLQNYL